METTPRDTPLDEGRMSPGDCRFYQERLAEACEALGKVGIAIPKKGRLSESLAAMGAVADAGVFPSGEAERRLLLAALRNAAEWHLIGAVLNDSLKGEFQRDVQRAMSGPLVPAEPGGEAEELQAQLFFGAVLVQDGLFLGSPTEQGFPDFVWPNGTLRHGVEVKAPSSRRGVQRAVHGADRQLCRYSGGGMLVVDISSLISGALATERPIQVDDLDGVEARVHDELEPLKAELRRRVRERGSWERGAGITATVMVGRVHHWHPSSDGGWPSSMMVVAWRRYYRSRGNLTWWRATALGERVGMALRALMPDLVVRWED